MGVRGLYYKYSEEDRLNEYLRAVDNLTLNAENRLLAKVDEFRKQEQEIHELKREKDKEIQILKEMMQLIFEKQDREDKIWEEFNSDVDKNLGSLKASDKAKKSFIKESKANKEIDKRLKEASAAILKDSKKSVKKRWIIKLIYLIWQLVLHGLHNRHLLPEHGAMVNDDGTLTPLIAVGQETGQMNVKGTKGDMINYNNVRYCQFAVGN